MPKHSIKILSTKALGKELISVAALSNIIIDEIPFIEIKSIEKNNAKKYIAELPDTNATLIFTSTNALNAVKDFITKKDKFQIFCIGNTTKNLAEEIFGKQSIAGFANNANELSKKIINDSSIKTVSFFCGDQRRDELPDNLKKNGIDVNEIVVYATIQTPVKVSKNYNGILFFSPSAVTSFFEVNTIDEATKIFAIGNTTAHELQLYTKHPVIITKNPDKEEMITLVSKHFTNRNVL